MLGKIEKKHKDLDSEIFSQFNLMLGIFTLKPKLREFPEKTAETCFVYVVHV